MITVRKALMGAAIAALTVPAISADDHGGASAAAEAAKQRHYLMEIVGTAFGGLGKIIKGEVQGDENIPNYTRIMLKAASLAPVHFAVDTRGTGVKTETKDAVWENWDDFAARAGKFGEDLTALDAAAKSGDKAAVAAAFRATARNCKGCHDEYKVPDEH